MEGTTVNVDISGLFFCFYDFKFDWVFTSFNLVMQMHCLSVALTVIQCHELDDIWPHSAGMCMDSCLPLFIAKQTTAQCCILFIHVSTVDKNILK